VRVNGTHYIASIDGSPPIRLTTDSATAEIIQGGRYTVFSPGPSPGLWITDGVKSLDEQIDGARLLCRPQGYAVFSYDGKYLFSLRENGECWRMEIPEGEWRQFDADFTGVANFHKYTVGYDGNDIVVRKARFISNIGMIEDLFESK